MVITLKRNPYPLAVTPVLTPTLKQETTIHRLIDLPIVDSSYKHTPTVHRHLWQGQTFFLQVPKVTNLLAIDPGLSLGEWGTIIRTLYSVQRGRHIYSQQILILRDAPRGVGGKAELSGKNWSSGADLLDVGQVARWQLSPLLLDSLASW